MKPWENYQAQETSSTDAPWLKYGSENSESANEDSKQPKISRKEAAFVAATNPLNFGPKIKAGIAAGYAKAFGGDATKDVPISDLYNEAKTTEEQKLVSAKEEYPIQSGAIGFASDIPLEVAGATKLGLTGAQKLGGKIYQNTVAGAGISALNTVGSNKKDDLGELVKDTAISALEGGATGATLTPVFHGAGVAANTAKNVVKNLLGKKSGQEIAEQSISKEAAQRGLNTLENSPEGQPTTALDVSEPEIQNLTRAIHQYPEAKEISADFAAGRKQEALNRIGDTLSKDVSPVDNAFKSIEELDTTRKTAVKPFIEEAYKQGEEIPTLFNAKGEAVDQSTLLGGKHLSAKQKALANEYEDVVADRRFQDYAKDFSNLKPNSVEMLHNVRKAVDKDRSALERNLNGPSPNAIAGSELRGLNNLRSKLKDVMYKATGSEEGKIGTMEKADQIYAGQSKLMDATNEGMNFSKLPEAEIIKKMESYSPGERDAFRVGVRQSMQDVAEGATKIAGKSSPAEKIFNDVGTQKQIKASFLGDEKKYNDFAKKMKEEIQYDKTIKDLGLSRKEIEKNKASAVNLIARLAADSRKGIIFEGVRLLEKVVLNTYKGINKKNAVELSKAFSNKETSIKTLQAIIKKADVDQKILIQKAINDIIPAILGGQINSVDSEAQAAPASISNENPDQSQDQDLNEEKILKFYNEERKKYPGIYSNSNPEEEKKMLEKRYYRG